MLALDSGVPFLGVVFPDLASDIFETFTKASKVFFWTGFVLADLLFLPPSVGDESCLFLLYRKFQHNIKYNKII